MGSDLITVAEFKTYRSIGNTKEDEKISELIVAASDMVKTYCNRTFVDFASDPKVEYFDGTKYAEIFIEEIPFININSVAYTEDGTTYTSLTENTDYFVNYDQDSIFFAGGIPPLTYSAFPARSIKITFFGGFEDGAPADIKQATMDIVEYYRMQQFTPRKTAAGATLENVGFRAGNDIGLPPHIKRVLEMYRVQ